MPYRYFMLRLAKMPNPSFHRTCRGKPRQVGEFRR